MKTFFDEEDLIKFGNYIREENIDRKVTINDVARFVKNQDIATIDGLKKENRVFSNLNEAITDELAEMKKSFDAEVEKRSELVSTLQMEMNTASEKAVRDWKDVNDKLKMVEEDLDKFKPLAFGLFKKLK